MDLQFEWDDEKSRANRRKHGVTFAEAASVFFDPRVVTLFDEGHSVDEDRFKAIGMSQQLQLLLVVHCDRGDAIRIISARRATGAERAIYESGQPT